MELKAFSVPVEQLVLDPKNSRRHLAADIEATANSLLRFGQQTPIVITADNMVAKGNGTTLAARLLIERQAAAAVRQAGGAASADDLVLLKQDWSKLWCLRTDLSGPALKAYSIADNKTGMLAPFDLTHVGEAMREFDAIGRLADYSIGWTERDIGSFLAPVDEADDPADKLDHADELLSKWGVSLGDLYLIEGRGGSHRLICGDSTQLEITRDLKQMAKECECTVLLLNQLNADADGAEPTEKNFSESKSILQNLDVSILLHRETKSSEEMTFKITKNRKGAPGEVKMKFIGAVQRLEEYELSQDWNG